MAQLNPLEIVKKLPRNNCQACGYPTCLAFAMALITGAVSPEKCPYLDPKDLGPLPQEATPSEDYAWRILEEIKEKARNLSWAELPTRTGGKLTEEGLYLPYLEGEVVVTPEKAWRVDGRELDPRDQILLYNYLLRAQSAAPSGRFVGLESFPSSLSKVQTLRRYAEEKCARTFSQRLSSLKGALSALKATFPADCPADLCAVVYVLPKVPLRLHFFDAEPAEGLPAEVKILFDEKALDFLDLESLVFSAERLVETLIELAKEEKCSS